MANEDGADVDDVKTGSGAPGAGSKDLKDGRKAEDGEELVPVSRLKAALATQKQHSDREIGSLRAEFEAFKAGSSKQAPEEKEEAPKRFSRSELSAAVKAGQVTQEQADDIFAKQVKDDAKDEAVRAALAAVSGISQQKGIDGDLAKYKRLEPDLRDRNSDLFAKVKSEFDYLRERGHPNNLATELAAMRAVLGDVEKLEKAKPATRSAEHHEESGGGGEGRKGGGAKTETMSAREKAYYGKQIEQGFYKDWSEVEKLLKDHARPEIRRRAGARV